MSRNIRREELDVPSAPRETVDDFRQLLLSDTPLLDVRAPVEFAKGAFPASVNLPLLTDEERHDVGVRYKQQGQDAAIVLGAELIDDAERSRRVAGWKAFSEEHPRAALYCFRGGLRSRITQAWLSDAGVDLPLVSGGYKALRSFLIEQLADLCERLPLRIVGGRTGVGKTLLIGQLGRTLDLEGIARHRGSSFGGVAESQPSNIDVENRIAIQLMRLDGTSPNNSTDFDCGVAGNRRGADKNDDTNTSSADAAGHTPIWLEDEARLIGRVALPEVLVQAMRRAPIEVLEAPLEVRVANCLDDYVVDLLARYRRRQHVASPETAAWSPVSTTDERASVKRRFDERASGPGASEMIASDQCASDERMPDERATDEHSSGERGSEMIASDKYPSDVLSDELEAKAFEAFATHHRGSLARVRKRLGGVSYQQAVQLLDRALAAHRSDGDTSGYVPFIELMLQRYYDPMYDYQLEFKRDRIRFGGDAAAILARHGVADQRASRQGVNASESLTTAKPATTRSGQ